MVNMVIDAVLAEEHVVFHAVELGFFNIRIIFLLSTLLLRVCSRSLHAHR